MVARVSRRRARVWAMRHYKAGPPIWLLLRRTTEQTDLKYYVSNASAETPWQSLALADAARWRVEECLEDGKMHLGMADYEARSWSSWHHHMSLVALAHLYVTLAKRDINHDVPELTLDLALRVLRSTFARATLGEDEAAEIIDYHLERARVRGQLRSEGHGALANCGEKNGSAGPASCDDMGSAAPSTRGPRG